MIQAKPSFSEKELWDGCLKGDRKFQHALFVQFLPVMFGLCLRYSKTRMDAEDLVQEGFMVVFREIKTFRGGSLEGWMKKVFINLCISQFRKEKRRQIWLEITDAKARQVADQDLTYEKDFLEREWILECINALPEGTRLAFNLYAIEGFSHAEIAKLLSIEESTSRVQVSRARRLLQEKIIQLHKPSK